MEKSKEALSGSDKGELGENSANGDNHVEPIPESSSHSAAFPEESLEGMEQEIGSITLLLLPVNQLKPQSIFLSIERPRTICIREEVTARLRKQQLQSSEKPKTRQSDSFDDVTERLVSYPTNARSWDRGTSNFNNCRIARISSITEFSSPKVLWQLEVFVL